MTTKRIILAALTGAVLLTSAPAFATAENPGAPGEEVKRSKEIWQLRMQRMSGWGERVSDKANGTVANPDGNLGQYLQNNYATGGGSAK